MKDPKTIRIWGNVGAGVHTRAREDCVPAGGLAMNDCNPVIKEIEDVDRRLWEAGGGTMHVFFDVCERIADQALAEYALYGDRWRGVGREPASAGEEKTAHAEAQREGGAEGKLAGCGVMAVCEGDAPKYGGQGE